MVENIKETPWRKPGKFWTSHYNWVDDVRSWMDIPEKVIIHDATLRDGEQSPGIALQPKEKVQIAQALDEMGVQRIEASMPVVSPEDAEAFKLIAKAVPHEKVYGFGRTYKPDIDAVIDCGGYGMVMEYTEPRGGYPSREAAARAVVEVLEYAKTHGLKTTLFITNSTRRDMDELENLWTAACDGHADSICVVDTFAGCHPWGMAYLVKKAKDFTKKPIEVHCHDRMDMGAANVLASVAAGAFCAHTNINGVNGQASLHNVVVNLIAHLGIDMGIDVSKLYPLSKYFEKVSSYPIFGTEPIVGPYTFTSSHNPPRSPPYTNAYVDPTWVGRATDMALGKMCGRDCIRWKLESLNIPVPDDKIVRELTAKVKKAHNETKKLVSDDEFRQMVEETA